MQKCYLKTILTAFIPNMIQATLAVNVINMAVKKKAIVYHCLKQQNSTKQNSSATIKYGS